MTQANSALSHANGVLRAHHLPFRLRVGHNSRWVSEARKQPDANLDQLLSSQAGDADAPSAHLAPCWPEICEAVVAFQRRQGVNMNRVEPVQGAGLFLPASRRSRCPRIGSPPLCAAHR